LQSIARIRPLAKEKYYVVYGETAIGRDKPDQVVVDQVEVMHRLAPSAFLFAYNVSWKRHSSFISAYSRGSGIGKGVVCIPSGIRGKWAKAQALHRQWLAAICKAYDSQSR